MQVRVAGRYIAVPLEERFWEHVSPEPTSGCWLWTGAITSRGYGNVRDGRRTDQAHRVAWVLTHGPVPHGLFVLHKCDNRACVNPVHLFLGTHDDNMADMDAKGRRKATPAPGETNASAKLTTALVEQARAEYAAGGVTLREMAPRYGVHFVTLASAIRGATWRNTAAALLAAAVLGLYPGAAAAAEPPAHPPRSTYVVVPPASSWTAPAGEAGGGLCLERPAWIYTTELRRYYEARIRAGEKVAERQGWKGAAVGFAAGILVGGLVALVR